jgi:aryl-alcohol dehydrogenase-like predicted oxidoreductase
MDLANAFASGTVPSPIVLGTGSFGAGIPREVAFAAMDAYLAAGGNVLDTANIYSSWEPGGVGASERTVGEWLSARKVRDRIILGTKGGHPALSAMQRSRCTLADLRSDFAESLDRLQLEHEDIYWLHRDHPGLPVAAIMDNLAELNRSRRIGCFGVSNWMPARIEEANAYAQRAGEQGFVINQLGWSLAAHATNFADASPMLYVDDAMAEWHQRTGLTLLAYSSQAGGYFGESNVQWARHGFPGDAPRGKAFDNQTNRLRLQRATALAERKSCSANQVALAWLLHQPFPTYPIIGSRSTAHIRESMGALQVRLLPEECRWLTEPLDAAPAQPAGT